VREASDETPQRTDRATEEPAERRADDEYRVDHDIPEEQREQWERQDIDALRRSELVARHAQRERQRGE